MTFTPARLPQGLNKNNCPSLESIINQAYAAGVGQDNELMGQFAGQAAATRGTVGRANLVGQPTAPELAQMSPFGRKLTQFGRNWLPSWIRGSNEAPLATSSPSPPPAAASPAVQPANGTTATQSPVPEANKTTDSQPANGTTSNEKPAEQPADKPAEQPSGKQDEKQPAPAAAPASSPAADSKQEPPAASPAPQQVATPVAIEPPTTNQTVGPKDKPSDAPAAADKAEDKAKAENKAPPAAPAPEPAKQPDSGSGLIPIPPEKDDSETPAEPTPAAAPEPAPAPAPAAAPQQGQPAPAVLAPLVPASQSADLWHQQLAANNGYLPNPAGAAGQAWGAYDGSTSQNPAAADGSQYPAVGGGYPASMFGDAPPQIKVTFMFGFSGNKTFAYGRGRVVSAPAGSIKYTVEAQNWCVGCPLGLMAGALLLFG